MSTRFMAYDKIDFTGGKFYIPNDMILAKNIGLLAENCTHHYLPGTHKNAKVVLGLNPPLSDRASVRINQLLAELDVRIGRIKRLSDAKAQIKNKEVTIDNFPWIDSEFKPIGEYQLEAIHCLMNSDAVLLDADCGLGKTYMSIQALVGIKERMASEGKKMRALVLCPKSLIDDAWILDVKKFKAPLSCLNMRKIKIPPKQNWVDIPGGHDVYLVNYDLITQPKWINALHQMKFDILIADESSKLKSSDATRAKACKFLSNTIPIKWLLSGSPMPNGIEDLWMQFFILDNGATLGNNKTSFMEDTHYKIDLTKRTEDLPTKGRKRGFGEFKWSPKKGEVDRVKKRIEPVVLRYKIDDCVDLPEQVFIRKYVPMPLEQQRVYNDLKTDFISFIDNGGVVLAKNALAEMSKFLQITGGFVKYSDDTESFYTFKENPKMDALLELLDEIEGFVLIWAWHQHETEAIARILTDKYKTADNGYECPAITSKMPDKERSRVLALARAGKLRHMVANEATIGHGHTLVAGHHCIYYSQNFNYELRHQTVKRIHRIGQTRTCYYYDLVGINTIDVVILDALMRKEAIQNFIMNPKVWLMPAKDYRYDNRSQIVFDSGTREVGGSDEADRPDDSYGCDLYVHPIGETEEISELQLLPYEPNAH